MKLNKLVLAIAVTSALSATTANATFLLPTSYDKQQDTKIDALQAKDDVLDKKINDTYAYVNTKYTEAAGKNLERQVTDLQNNKVDKSVFSADQARQDKATADLNSKVDSYATQGAAAYTEIKGSISANAASQAERDAGQDDHINAVQGAAQAANEKGDALAVRADGIEKQAGVLDGRVGQTEVRLDNAEGAIRDVQGAAQTANDRAGAAEVRLDGVEQKNVEQDAHINAVQDVAAAADSRSQNNAVRLDTVEGGLRDTNKQLEVTDARSINNAVRLDSAEGAIRETNTQVAANDKAINTRVNAVQQVQTQHTAQLADHETRITTNTSEIKKTQTVVAEQGKVINNHETRITNNETNISNLSNDYYQFQDTYNYNNQVINQNMRSYSAQAVQQSKAYTDQQVGQLRNEVRDNQKEYRSGIASVAAMANIPVVPGQTFTVGAGIGQFKDRTALAVGVGANISPNVAAKASVGFSNDSDAVVGAGIGFGF